MDMTLQEIRMAIRRDNPADNGIAMLTEYLALHPDDDQALTLRGLRHWSRGERAAAINDYLAAIRINPDSQARQALAATNEILDFYNKELYNP